MEKIGKTLQLLFTTTRIDVISNKRKGSGTGFFFSFPISETQSIPVLITNKHVVEKAEKGYLYFHTANNDGDVNLNTPPFIIEIDNFKENWIFHPDKSIDLCILPISPLAKLASRKGVRLFYKTFSPDFIPDIPDLEKLIPLEEVIMIGYPIGLRDEKHNLPIIRKGSTASHPVLDYNGKPEFVIDMACFPGSSGSPVLIYNEGGYPTRGGIVLGSRIYLLGALYAGPQFTTEGKIVIKSIPTRQIPISRVSIPINLGYVIKSSRILDFQKILIYNYHEPQRSHNN